MKNSNKIFLWLMLLCVCFVAPKDVLAATIKTTSCTCSADGVSTSLTFTKGNTPTIGDIDWGGKIDEVLGAPSSNKTYHKDLNEGECPTVVVKKMTYTSASDNFDGSTANKTRAIVYFYSPAYASSADSWTLSGCENQNQIFSSGQRSSLCKELVSAKLNCTVKEVKDVKDTSTANNTNDSETDNASGDEESEERTRIKRKASKYDQKQKAQNCEGVFGSSSDKNSVAWILQKLFNYIRIFGILLAIVLSALDYTKVVLSNDYEAMKKNQTRFVYRIGGIVALLLLPTLINFLLGLFISGTVTDFSCGIF